MAAGSISEEVPLGLLEFEADGTVLYYNRDSRDDSRGAAHEMVGRNLFAELMPAAQGEQFRLLVRHFLGSRAASQSHRLSFARGGSMVNLRVLLARLRVRSARQGRESVLMHIREEFAQS